MARAELIAVSDEPDADVLAAILVHVGRKRPSLIEWWGGYASQTLSKTVGPGEVLDWPGWRPFTMALPEDWKEGYLRSVAGEVEFVYGKPPHPAVDPRGEI